jgi:hypothetical protein
MITTKAGKESKNAFSKTATAILALLFIVVLCPVLLNIDVSQAMGDSWNKRWKKPDYCSETAKTLVIACYSEASDDYLVASANCINVDDPEERKECKADAWDEKIEGRDLCKEQFEARLEVCGLVGEERYDPEFDPANFVDPLAIGNVVDPNPYFPLVPGTQWVYEGGDEVITVKVTEKTKLIEGVTCIVVNDLVAEDGVPVENTDDWYAQDKEGNVWYCGEIAKNYETFEGDDPEEPELVDIEGSWKAGRDGAKPGYLMLAAPQVGDVYRQEVSWGDAEDVAEVTSTTGSETVPAASCSGDCLITRDFTAIEPGINESKYYAPGVGLILEVDDEGNRVELVEMIKP